MPHALSDSGIGLFFIQVPVAYLKKSFPGLTLLSMFFVKKSSWGNIITEKSERKNSVKRIVVFFMTFKYMFLNNLP
jgi:hypothetical protein